MGRVLIGLIAGAGLIVWSERFRRKGFSAFSYSLKAIGSGVLYLTLWAAYQLYHLMPPPVALGGMILVTAWNAYMAWAQNAELLAAYALAGGLSTPLLLSTGGNHQIFLFTYLLAIDAATVALVRVRPWPRLLLGAFPATVLYFIAWYSKFYEESAFGVTTIFVGLFFFVFTMVSLRTAREDVEAHRGIGSLSRFIPEILLPLGNAAFGSLALYSVMQDSGRHWFLPWLMLIFAATYLLITRLPQGQVAAAMHLSLCRCLPHHCHSAQGKRPLDYAWRGWSKASRCCGLPLGCRPTLENATEDLWELGAFCAGSLLDRSCLDSAA